MFNGIHHLAFITNDLNKTIRFYRDLLGFPLVAGVSSEEFKHYFFRFRPVIASLFSPTTAPRR